MSTLRLKASVKLCSSFLNDDNTTAPAEVRPLLEADDPERRDETERVWGVNESELFPSVENGHLPETDGEDIGGGELGGTSTLLRQVSKHVLLDAFPNVGTVAAAPVPPPVAAAAVMVVPLLVMTAAVVVVPLLVVTVAVVLVPLPVASDSPPTGLDVLSLLAAGTE
jgi:hypothetical protein